MNSKRLSFLLGLAILVICLTSCVSAPQSDVAMMEIPCAEWNATPEEVKESLGLTKDQILVDAQGQGSEYMDVWVLTATEVSLFGEEITQAQFHFVKYTEYDHFGLDSVRIYYPDEVDMTAVRNTLIDTYGEGNEKGITRYRISNNTVVSSIDSPLQANTTYWVNSCKGTDVLSKKVQEAVIDIYTTDKDVILEFLDKNPLVTLYCTGSAGEGNLSDDDLITCNRVEFSAGTYIDLIQRFGK